MNLPDPTTAIPCSAESEMAIDWQRDSQYDSGMLGKVVSYAIK